MGLFAAAVERIRTATRLRPRVAVPAHDAWRRPTRQRRPRVVIVGGGFGGLAVANALRRAPVQVVLIDRRNHHLFQPLLYQVATGGLSPANIAMPLRSVLRRHRDTRVLMAEVVDVDLEGRQVMLRGRRVAYDYLVVAAGSDNFWFGNDRWADAAPGLKTVEDATRIRARLLHAFEMAELEPEYARAWLTFVVIGGGPTGVEMAGAIGELAHDTLRHDFRAVDTARSRIVLIESADRVLPPYSPDLSEKAREALERLGVEVRTGTSVTTIDERGVSVTSDGHEERINARNVIWAAGVRAVPLAAIVAARAGVEVDRGGRVPVQPDLTLPGHPEVAVIGDMAGAPSDDGGSLPGIAPVAIQQGRYVAKAIQRELLGKRREPFRYHDRGAMATIGRGHAVFQRGRFHIAGFPGWLGWLFIHLLQLSGFENRLLVFTQWAWSYVTRNRTARLIAGREAQPRQGAE